MLCEITIENVAVIEKATVSFNHGLNVLTGETGAGKSILIDSINAILGSRTSREIVRTGAQKACIWATFNNVTKNTLSALENAGYKIEDELLLYREISVDGKSSCRINGMPTTAAVIRDICADLINIHGQHDNQSLMNPVKHITILDAFAQNKDLHAEYYAIYRELCKIKREIDSLNMNEDEKAKRTELLQFQIDEIYSANLSDGEEAELTQKRNIMLNAQTIMQKLNSAHNALSGDDDTAGACEAIGTAANSINGITQFSEKFMPLSEKLNDLFYVSQEIIAELNSMRDDYNFNASELEEIEERLDLIYKLRQKYKLDISQIIKYAITAQEELNSIELGANRLDELYVLQDEYYEKALDLSERLTASRIEAFKLFNSQISKELNFLNMPGISFALNHKTGPLTGIGRDVIEFYISTNPGEDAKPLAKIASGGELSRIMLAVKSAMADKDDIPSIIYDEIDTGVSGLAAARIGEKLKQTANGRQVICITHTAQIAANADEHLLIKKNISDGRTYTNISLLLGDDRVREIARMVSGDLITDLAMANAREMLELHVVDN